MIIIGILFLIVFLVYIVVFRNSVNSSYECKCGKFKIKGKKRKFIVEKDGRFEFLISNGEIIACKDTMKNSEFIYYGGNHSGTNR